MWTHHSVKLVWINAPRAKTYQSHVRPTHKTLSYHHRNAKQFFNIKYFKMRIVFNFQTNISEKIQKVVLGATLDKYLKKHNSIIVWWDCCSWFDHQDHRCRYSGFEFQIFVERLGTIKYVTMHLSSFFHFLAPGPTAHCYTNKIKIRKILSQPISKTESSRL